MLVFAYMLCIQNARVSISGFFLPEFFFVLRAFLRLVRLPQFLLRY
jgi:hypothetical protein